ncbi:MAG: hypothetical protein AAFQ53_00435 [Bacteroidota bacterium]
MVHLFIGWSRGKRGAGVYLRYWAPGYQHLPAGVLVQQRPNSAIVGAAVARSLGYSSWPETAANWHVRLDPVFEAAVDAVVRGDARRLEHLLSRDPSLARGRSALAHGATLLHYVAANGVEIWRQRVPAASVRITRLLRYYGADPGATMNVYDGAFDVASLAQTSSHVARFEHRRALLAALGC